MQKTLSVFFFLFLTLFAAPLFSQSPEKTEEQPNVVVTKEAVNENNRQGTITLEFFTATHDARFTYSCDTETFDRDTAMLVIRVKAEAFAKANGYDKYTRIGEDETRHAAMVTTYISRLLFKR